MMELNSRRCGVSFQEYCNGAHFRLGLQDAAQGKPWRELSDTNNAWEYERARHFLTWWRTLGRPKAPAYVGKKLAPWVIDGFAEAYRARIVV